MRSLHQLLSLRIRKCLPSVKGTLDGESSFFSRDQGSNSLAPRGGIGDESGMTSDRDRKPETLEDLTPEEKEIVLAFLKAYAQFSAEQTIKDLRLMVM